MALTPNVAGNDGGGGGGGIVDDNSHEDPNNNRGRGSGSSGSSNHNEDPDGYDSEKCPTPELSSPLRSTNISARDLQVLTPSAARADRDGNSNTGGGSYRRDTGGNCDDYDDRHGSCNDSDACPTPELSSPLRSAGSAALCRRRLEEAGGGDGDEAGASGGPLELVSEEEYAKVRGSGIGQSNTDSYRSNRRQRARRCPTRLSLRGCGV